MCLVFSEDEPEATNDIEISVSHRDTQKPTIIMKITIKNHAQTAETVEAIVGQLMEKQRLARQAALVIIDRMGLEFPEDNGE